MADLLQKQDDGISTESIDKTSALLDNIKGTYIVNDSYNM